eukprot:TRINITY_DN3985_c0_g1_i1.p1 TRINITY_DN3985_c0_g1~~TRINITY_DN3985_c0_g1_i1.p1  ORF type:complete len:805 (+),score=193.69 TRINITY_DN3985_c0_g1_i1:347-2416(+)
MTEQQCPYRVADVSVLSFNVFSPFVLLSHVNSTYFTWPGVLAEAEKVDGIKVAGVGVMHELFHKELIKEDSAVRNLKFVDGVSSVGCTDMMRRGEVQLLWGSPTLYHLNRDLMRPIVVASRVMVEALPDVASLSQYGLDTTEGIDRGLAVSASVASVEQELLASWIEQAGRNDSFLREAKKAGFMPEFITTPGTVEYVNVLFEMYHATLFPAPSLKWVYAVVAVVPSVLGVLAVAAVVVAALLLYRHKRRMLLVDFERSIEAQALTTQTPATRVLKALLDVKRFVPSSYQEELTEASRLLVSASLNHVDFRKAGLESDATNFLKGLMVDMRETSSDSSSEVTLQTLDNLKLEIPDRELEEGSPWCLMHRDMIMQTCEAYAGWDYSPIDALQQYDGHTLQAFMLYFFTQAGLLDAGLIDLKTLCWFAAAVEGHYHANPFHNQGHAADVLQATYFLMTQPSIAQYISRDQKFSTLLAASCHDLDHPGRTNNFLIESHNELAINYNDTSVLENHHIATMFRLCREDERQNIFRAVPPAKAKAVRKRVIQLVLATDLSMHFSFVANLKNRLAVSFSPTTNDEDMTILLRTIIKCADLSNPARPEKVSRYWTAAVTEEFFQQGDEERARGMTISAFMDRTQPRTQRCQVLFIDNVVMQLWRLCAQLTHSDEMVANLERNRELWLREMRDAGDSL